jgi:plastocyanin
MMPSRTSLIVVAVLGLMSVSARAATIQITIDKLVFAPVEVAAKVGDTVEWVNKDMLAHTATGTHREFNVVIGPKKTARLVLKKAGSFDYYCTFHPNMKGRLVVTP